MATLSYVACLLIKFTYALTLFSINDGTFGYLLCYIGDGIVIESFSNFECLIGAFGYLLCYIGNYIKHRP